MQQEDLPVALQFAQPESPMQFMMQQAPSFGGFGGVGTAIANGLGGVGNAINRAVGGVTGAAVPAMDAPASQVAAIPSVTAERAMPPRPSLNPFGFFGAPAERNRQLEADWQGRVALVDQLEARGIPRAQAIQMANNPTAMKLALETAEEQRTAASNRRLADTAFPSQTGGDQAAQSAAPASQREAPTGPNAVTATNMTAAEPQNQSRLNQLLERRANVINSALRDPRISRQSVDMTVRQIDQEIRNLSDAESNKRFSLQPIYGVDAQGNPVVLQLGQDGRAAQAAMPEGVRIQRDPIRIDAGTETVLLDPVTRQRIGSVPKNIAAAAAQQEVGKSIGNNAADAGQAITVAQTALQTLDQMLNHPGRQSIFGTGVGGVVPAIPGTEQAGFVRLFEQVKSQSFLQAFESLKGGGAITEAEGRAATAALNRLDRATNQRDFDQAAADVRRILQSGIDRANAARARFERLPGSEATPLSAPAQSSAPANAAPSRADLEAEARRRGLIQ